MPCRGTPLVALQAAATAPVSTSRYTLGVKRGMLIAFEGIDGCGKSTQLAMLADALRARSVPVVTTREPTDGEWGRRIREMARSGARVAPQAELDWFVRDRREHVRAVIEPALEAGQVVLTDRYYLSSVAYQGARGLDWRDILERSEAEFPLPDLAILVEVDPDDGLARVRARGGVAEPVFEEIAFQREVARVFAALTCPYIVRIPGGGSPEEVHRRVAGYLEARLGL